MDARRVASADFLNNKLVCNNKLVTMVETKDWTSFLSASSSSGSTHKVLVADLQLLLSSIMFGFGFVVQRAAMVDGLGPLTFNALRYVVSAIVMVGSAPLWNKPKPKEDKLHSTSMDDLEELQDNTHSSLLNNISSPSNITTSALATSNNSSIWNKYIANIIFLITWFTSKLGLTNINSNKDNASFKGGFLGSLSSYITSSPSNSKESITLKNKFYLHFWSLLLCSMNFCASTTGQIGIQYVSASASAFITGFYVILTPILSYFIPNTGEKPTTNTWIAVSGSMIGLFVISGSTYNDIRIGHGELLTLLSAIFWTLHIFVTEKAVQCHDAIELTMNEMTYLAIFCSIFAGIWEEGEWEFRHLLSNWVAIVAMGLMECIGFTLSALGQMYAPPTHVAIILATEAVFATIGGYTFLNEAFTMRESFGCFLMMASMVIAKIGEYNENKRVRE